MVTDTRLPKFNYNIRKGISSAFLTSSSWSKSDQLWEDSIWKFSAHSIHNGSGLRYRFQKHGACAMQEPLFHRRLCIRSRKIQHQGLCADTPQLIWIVAWTKFGEPNIVCESFIISLFISSFRFLFWKFVFLNCFRLGRIYVFYFDYAQQSIEFMRCNYRGFTPISRFSLLPIFSNRYVLKFSWFFRTKNDTRTTHIVHKIHNKKKKKTDWALSKWWKMTDEKEKNTNNKQNIYINRNYKWSRSPHWKSARGR